MLNMIVGVVVENFQRCRERLEDEEKQRRRRKLLEKTKNKDQEGEYQLFFLSTNTFCINHFPIYIKPEDNTFRAFWFSIQTDSN